MKSVRNRFKYESASSGLGSKAGCIKNGDFVDADPEGEVATGVRVESSQLLPLRSS